MTEKEFTLHNLNRSMPKTHIGQGYGYKADTWDNDNDIIYIPEYAYTPSNTVKRENAYSLNDLISVIIKDAKDSQVLLTSEEARDKAITLFDILDWQLPESCILEEWFEYDK
ncbi:MAG: hypothetical protein K6D02_01815 [Lachnospiraceae bacterium]|nr:hypothetical protein [Lachnospiraceae bacterium]